MTTIRGGVKDRIIHEIGRAIKQAQLEWCGVGCVRACTGRWLVLSLDAALLHGLRSLGHGYWPVVATLLDRPSLNTITALPYATKPLTRGRSWICLCLNEGQLENYIHVLTSHTGLLAAHYEGHGLLRDPHRAHLLLMLAAGLEHLKFAIPMDVPGWMQAQGSLGSSSGTSMNSMSLSLTSMGSSLPSPSLQDPFDLDTTCSEALEENWLSVEGVAPVSYPKYEDLDTSIHIEHIPKVSRRKRQSRSSSHNSSGGTTPITSTPISLERKKKHQPQGIIGGSVGGGASVPLDDRTEAPLSGGKNCDNYCKEGDSAARSKDDTNCYSRLVGDNVQTQGFGKKSMLVNDTHPSCVETKSIKENKHEGQQNEEPKVVLRQNVSSMKNSEKRVSFTDTREAETNNKTMHKRLSLCSSSGRGMEIRDLSDLKELLSSLKVQGMLPITLSLDDLFTSFEQSSPVLSERAPPEGQEDPPLHQSITSLFQNNNNNNSNSDDSNNNNASDVAAGEVSDSEQERSAPQETEPQVGCFSHHSDIIDGVRWEELTKIGQEMLKEGCQEDGKIGKEVLISRICQDYRESDTQRPTGTRPKRRQDYLNQTDIQTWQSGSKNSSLQRFSKRASCYSKAYHTNLADRRQLYKKLYKEKRRLPSLYIPAKVEPSTFKEEEERLALEVAQGQSNLTLPGAQVDALSKQRFTSHLFTSEEEKFYRMFSLREGHSTGQSVGVQVVLSTHALYVVAPLPRGAKPRHILKYSDIHSIIVGVNDQWVCVLSKEAMQRDIAAAGAFPGVQLEVGDPDVTHSLMNSLELAVRRHFLSGKLGARPVTVLPSEKDLKPSTRKGFLQEFTRECVDNFSNSLLEESLLNAWDSRKSVDVSVSQEFSESSEASPAVTPGSTHSSQGSTDASQLSTDISDMSNDTSQSITDASHTSGEVNKASSDASQVSNDISHLSSDVILGSTDSSRHASDLSNSLSDETPTSSDMVQSLSSISDGSLSISQTSGQGEPESCDTSQKSRGTIKDSSEAEHTHPVELQLQKQNTFYSFAGGYSRWNGAYLEQSLPAVVVHPSWELLGLSRWLRTKLRLQESPEVIGYWLVDWEDGSSLGGGDSVYGPLGPTKEGSLMFKPTGLLMPWRPAYFILKAGVLYQFNDARERLPHMIVEVVQCVGCVRLSSSQRPHAFQLLRKKEAPLMLAASDEHQASLWLQAFLTIINSGVRDISERIQMPCRVVLLESRVLLAQQSDLFLGPPPKPDSHTSEKDNSGTTSQQLGSSPNTQPPQVQLPVEKKDPDKPKNMHLFHVKERKPLSSSLTSLNHINGTSSVPGSPIRRISCGEKCLSPARKSLHLRQNSLSRLPDIEAVSERQHIEQPLPSPSSPQKKLSVQHIPNEKAREEDKPHHTESYRYTGEVKVLTISALEQLASVSIYAECPTTCLLEFECSEAGEISGDWALYFRSGGQLQQFLAALAHTWQSCSQIEFPLRRVEDAGVQQFLLEGSQISSNGWSLLHL